MVISSIDLMQGKAVQLKQGREKVLERNDPLALAAEFNRYGDTAVIDLDAAMGNGENTDVIKAILKQAECRVGGGIRSVDKAKELISYGATKVIIGSQAFEHDAVNHPFLQELVAAIGKPHIIIAIDARHGNIVTHGWKHQTTLPLLDAARELEPYASEFLFTCVEREGMMQGIDMALVNDLVQATTTNVTVAGGVSTLEEVSRLAALGADVQLGMALYTGKINLIDAFVECLNWKTELLPTITQDETGQVLMLAYSTKDSLRKTFESGRMTYFSRSRNELWTKGETSGHTQEFITLRPDCDRDALLATVRQTGPACHLESYSCFGSKRFNLQELYTVIEERIRSARPGSYTATLTDELLREKIMEEAQEVIEAEGRDEVIWEAADVLYFLTVLLVKSGVSIDDVLGELSRRRKK